MCVRRGALCTLRSEKKEYTHTKTHARYASNTKIAPELEVLPPANASLPRIATPKSSLAPT